MTDSHDNYHQFLLADLIDNAVGPHTNRIITLVLAIQLLTREWMHEQIAKSRIYAHPISFAKFIELFSCAWKKYETKQHIFS